jgi:hypothetical protein
VVFCRHRKCRTKLKAPASNPREAFCSRGCHTSFYLKRCLVCEGPLQRRNKTQWVCRKARCRSAWRARAGFGRYTPSRSVSSPAKTSDFIDSKPPLKPDRACRQIAGSKLSPRNCIAPWSALRKPSPKPTRKIAPTGESIMPRRSFNHHPPVNILGGCKFPNGPEVRGREENKPPPKTDPT